MSDTYVQWSSTVTHTQAVSDRNASLGEDNHSLTHHNRMADTSMIKNMPELVALQLLP